MLTRNPCFLQTFVEVQHWAINYSKENWDDPWTFNPERFLSGGSLPKDNGNMIEALQPFSVGPRNCIGRKYDDDTPSLFLIPSKHSQAVSVDYPG